MDLLDHQEMLSRLRSVDDEALMRLGKAAKNRCVLESQYGRPPLQDSVALLEHARLEWRRRYPNGTIADSF